MVKVYVIAERIINSTTKNIILYGSLSRIKHLYTSGHIWYRDPRPVEVIYKGIASSLDSGRRVIIHAHYLMNSLAFVILKEESNRDFRESSRAMIQREGAKTIEWKETLRGIKNLDINNYPEVIKTEDTLTDSKAEADHETATINRWRMGKAYALSQPGNLYVNRVAHGSY